MDINKDLWDEPEWVELVIELEADVASQWEWFEAHKDDPPLD